MSIEELLKPTIKVLSDIPFTFFKEGQVLQSVLSKDGKTFIIKYIDFTTGEEANRSVDFFLGFKKLFTLMEWWEEKSIDELPLYLKHEEDGYIIRAKKYTNYELSGIFVTPDNGGQEDFISNFLPATEEEYIQYQQNKNVCQ